MSRPATSPLVNAAIVRLQDDGMIGGGSPKVEVLAEQELVRSTVRLLEVTDDGGSSVQVYHKSIKPRTESRKAATLLAEERDSLSVAARLEHSLAERLPAPQVQIGVTLAVDIENLEQVTLRVPGRHLGALWRRALTPARRDEAREAVWLVGRACRAMEQTAGHQGPLPDRLVGDAVVERRVARLRGRLGDADREQLRRLMGELESEAMRRSDALYRSHGDLNATNVLIHSQGISLIDFAWHPSLRLTDVAHFAYRLEYESGSPRAFARELTEALIGGYGADVRQDPAWRFLRYSKLIRVVSGFSTSKNPMARVRAARARKELESAVRDQ